MRYAGDSARVGVVTPAEAAAYFGRMTAAPSRAYRSAVATAVTRWKAIGVWPYIAQLVIAAADTSQAALLDLSANARDATITGALTHTANKGFTGFDGANRLNFPITSADLVDDNFTSVFAGIVNYAAPAVFIENSTSAAIGAPGNCYTATPNGVWTGASTNPVTVPGSLQVCGGTRGNAAINASGRSASGSGTIRRSSYRTAFITPDHPLDRFLAYGSILSTVTADQARRFFVVLSGLLDAVDAFN